MGVTLHITNGDCAGEVIGKSGMAGEVLVWNDLLYDGPRIPGWPDDAALDARAGFLSATTGGGLGKAPILSALKRQYQRLAGISKEDRTVLWFDACLCDQAMLAHILVCLRHLGIEKAELLCVDGFPGVAPFNGLGQLQPAQMASLYDQRRPVSQVQFAFAQVVDQAFATHDLKSLAELAARTDAPLPWVAAAAARWLQEQPDPVTGLGRLESLSLEAVRSGCETPCKIFAHVAAADLHPQYWGDTALWGKINGLALRDPPLLRIQGPGGRLPQWHGSSDLKDFKITGLPRRPDAGGDF